MDEIKNQIDKLQLYTELVIERNELRRENKFLRIIALIEIVGIILLVGSALLVSHQLGI